MMRPVAGCLSAEVTSVKNWMIGSMAAVVGVLAVVVLVWVLAPGGEGRRSSSCDPSDQSAGPVVTEDSGSEDTWSEERMRNAKGAPIPTAGEGCE